MCLRASADLPPPQRAKGRGPPLVAGSSSPAGSSSCSALPLWPYRMSSLVSRTVTSSRCGPGRFEPISPAGGPHAPERPSPCPRPAGVPSEGLHEAPRPSAKALRESLRAPARVGPIRGCGSALADAPHEQAPCSFLEQSDAPHRDLPLTLARLHPSFSRFGQRSCEHLVPESLTIAPDDVELEV